MTENFPAKRKWLDYLWKTSNGPIIRPSAAWGGHGFTFGDWIQPVGDNRKPRPTIADDCAATIYHFISTDLAAKIAALIAALIAEDAQAKALRDRAETIRAAFKHEFFSPSGRIAHNDQISWSLAFLYGLVPAECRAGWQACQHPGGGARDHSRPDLNDKREETRTMKTIRHRTALAGAIILAAGLAPAETVLSLTIDGNQDTNQHDGRPDRRLYRREPGRDLRGREPPGRGRGGTNWSGRALPRERLGTSCNTTRARFFTR